jgi:hypothetical protein
MWRSYEEALGCDGLTIVDAWTDLGIADSRAATICADFAQATYARSTHRPTSPSQMPYPCGRGTRRSTTAPKHSATQRSRLLPGVVRGRARRPGVRLSGPSARRRCYHCSTPCMAESIHAAVERGACVSVVRLLIVQALDRPRSADVREDPELNEHAQTIGSTPNLGTLSVVAAAWAGHEAPKRMGCRTVDPTSPNLIDRFASPVAAGGSAARRPARTTPDNVGCCAVRMQSGQVTQRVAGAHPSVKGRNVPNEREGGSDPRRVSAR